MNGARGYREETALLPTFIAFLPSVQIHSRTQFDVESTSTVSKFVA